MKNSVRSSFSVSMCVYNGDDAGYFRSALDSIINQSTVPDEIVLVVDGPVSKLHEEVIDAFLLNEVCEFKVIRLQKNVGHGEARRIGLMNTANDIIALMDSDDISSFDRFEKQLEVLTNKTDVSVVGSNISEFISSTENVIARRVVPESDEKIKSYMKKRCPMNQVTAMFRKKDIDSVGGYIDWYCEEDYYLWIRLALEGYRFYNIQEDLVSVRVGTEMYQRRGGWKYFISEAKLQHYMYKHKIISLFRMTANCVIRFILQVVMTNNVRSFMFKTFARNK